MARKPTNKKSTAVNKMATRRKAADQKLVIVKRIVSRRNIYIGLLLVISGLLATYFWLGIYEKQTKDLMPIRVVKIEGDLQQVSREQIIEQLLKEPAADFAEQNSLQGSEYIGFLGSNLQLLEQRLETIAWLQTAELRRVWPDKLHIKIQEQKAIARWNDDSLINQFGEMFTPERITGLEALPLLTGPDQEIQKMLQTFKELQQLLTAVELKLAVLNLNKRYSWSLQLSNGIQLQVGRKNLVERVERFIALYPLLRSESKLPIAKVDLRYDTGLAVTRLETSELQASL